MDPIAKAAALVYRLARRSAAARERRGLRRPARAAGAHAAAASGQARAVSPPLPLHPRRRVSGHEPRAVRARQAARRRARQRLRRRRRRPVDLRLARRGHPEHPRLQEGLSRRRGRAARGELPLDAADPRAGERRHQRQHVAHGQDAARDARRRRARHARRARSTSATRRSSSSRRSREASRAVAAAAATSRCSTAPTRRAARSKRRCAATRFRIGSSARCASTIGARSAISWRTSS